jgi:hypothetical protein
MTIDRTRRRVDVVRPHVYTMPVVRELPRPTIGTGAAHPLLAVAGSIAW